MKAQIRPSIPQWTMLTWQSQAVQYDWKGEPGLSYFAGDLPETDKIVHCLLFRNEKGHLVGILNYYDWDSGWEKPGNFNIFIHRLYKGQGIGTMLFKEANRRWGPLNLAQQRWSEEGARWMEHLIETGVVLQMPSGEARIEA